MQPLCPYTISSRNSNRLWLPHARHTGIWMVVPILQTCSLQIVEMCCTLSQELLMLLAGQNFLLLQLSCCPDQCSILELLHDILSSLDNDHLSLYYAK